jgi:hypothetical protein
MDSFPDIRSFSTDELRVFLAGLVNDAEQSTAERPASSGYDVHVSDTVPLEYRRRVLNGKIDRVRAELASRGGRRGPDTG